MACVILALRLPWTAWRGRWKPALPIDGTSVLRMRARPTDIDLYRHINNGRFLTLMDLGRTDLAARTRMLRVFAQQRWRPVAGGATIRFRRPINILRRYELHTRVAGWHDRWVFFEQVFLHGDTLHARGYVKVAVLGRDGRPVDMGEVLAACGWEGPAPELPAGITAWQASDAS
jgi:acyl-CoA thioesterase FadM